MDNSDLSPEQTLFQEFCLNPKEPTIEIIQGSHRFISLSMENGSSIPKKSTLSELFKEFMTVPAKQYVFDRIPRRMLLELAICILQDIASRGVLRAKSLRLEVVKTTATAGGKTIVIGRDEESSASTEANDNVLAEDATFKFADNTGATPDVAFSIGKNHQPPYQQPDKQGYFTPSRRSRRSLQENFNEAAREVKHY